jgi:hypothetical protein
MAVGGIVGMTAFAVSVPGPFEGLFNADLALLIAWSLSTVVFILVTLMISEKGETS